MLVALRVLRNLIWVALAPLWLLGRWLSRPRSRWVELRLSAALPEVAPSHPLWQHLLRRRRLSGLRTLAELRRVCALVAADARIEGVVVHVPHLRIGWAGCASVRDVLLSLRTHGKRVVAYLPLGAGNRELYVALAADRVLCSPQAPISLLGVASQSIYYAPLLSRIGLHAEAHARGEYKTAGEPALRDSMSEPQREQLSALMQTVQAELEASVALRPGFDLERARALFENGSWGARAAAEAGLIDGSCYEDELPRELGIAGEDKRAQPMPAARYAAWRRARLWRRVRPLPAIAVVSVHGAIAAETPSVPIPGSRIAALDAVVGALRQVRRDERVRAVLLYVDSPGGSALASDLIHREIVRLREKKPVVAYFGDVAASGGYYVAAPCQRIVAQATTVTGSIGVISLRLLAGELAERIGLRPQTLRAAPHADMLSPFRALDEREQAMFSAETESIYQAFVGVVAQGRKRDAKEIEPLARGRVWSGRDALRVGLVDELGNFDSALAALRELTPELRGVADDRFEVRVVSAPADRPPPPPEPAQAARLSELLPHVPSELRDALSLFGRDEHAFLYAFVPELS
jgi:protease-4